MKVRIGMRNIKTAIAVFLCVLLFRPLGLESPFYAAIAAVISMGSSITNSFKTGRNRVIGTLIGAAVGLAFASIQPNNAVLSGIGIIIVIYICNLIKGNKCITVASVVFIAIMVNLEGRDPTIYSINRIIETSVGILIGLAVNYMVFPYTNVDVLLECRRRIGDKIKFIINETICRDTKVDISDFRKDISDLSKELDIYESEFSGRNDKRIDIESINQELELYYEIYRHMRVMQELAGQCSLSPDNIEKLESLDYCDISIADRPHNELDIVYNYHVAKIAECLDDLRPLMVKGQTA